MKRGSTLFLKVVILIFGIAVFALCVFLTPYALGKDEVGGYRPILVGMLVAAVPFFFGLYQALKLLNLTDKNKAFSQNSVQALGKIKYCGIAISILYAFGMPYIFIVAEQDDAPGVILIGLIFTFAPMVVAVFAAVLQKLLQNAIDLKSENDLIV